MRIQCTCGAEYDLDTTPEMVAKPLSFVCSSCGADHSEMLSELLRQESAGSPAPPATEACLKHGWPITHHCLVCQKSICPKCMEVFGYVCSARCTEAARQNGLNLPIYEGHLPVIQARERRKRRLKVLAVSAALVILLGALAWYQFVATRPRVAWSVHFPESTYVGEAKLIPPHDAVVRRGDRLIRYDLAAKKERWSVAIDAPRRSEEDRSPLPWSEQNGDIWVAAGEKVVRFDGRTGEVAQEIQVGGLVQRFFPGDSAISVVARGNDGSPIFVRINLADGGVQRGELTLSAVAKTDRPPVARASSPDASSLGGGPAPLKAARALQLLANRPLPPEDDEEGKPIEEPFDPSGGEILGAGGSLVQFSVKRLEKRMVTVQAMKDAPVKPALDGDISAASSLAVINETLNDWQRERTGGVELEDSSRYQVTLKRLLEPGAAEWIGEVIGPPELFPLSTVNVLIAGRHLLVFDKANRKVWEGKLAYPVSSRSDGSETSIPGEDGAQASPCLERDGKLFIVDRGIVTAFDLASGNVLWRLPGVGTSKVIFDDRGMIYLNTTDASQERIKYSQQIDIQNKTRQLILKVDSNSGKILWRARNVGRLAKATGNFLYSVEWAPGEDLARPRINKIPAHLRIYRLNPADGGVIWEYYQAREPLAFDFDHNTVQMLFKQDMQILKFFSF